MQHDQQARYERFRQLHDGPGAFVVANAWDAGSARLLAGLGFKALATTSAGLAFSRGVRDSAGQLSRDEVIDNAAAIAAASPVPVTADLEGGFGDAPEACAETVRQAMQAGLAGGSIEDASGHPQAPIFDFGFAVERVAAAAEAVRDAPFVLTARSENYLWGRPDLDDTILRLQAFSKAGADVLYAPGLTSLEDIAAVCGALDKPVNVVMGLKGRPFSVAELAEVGVRRISVGGSFARAALGALMRAGREVCEEGTFTYASEALSNDEATRLVTGE